MPVPTPYGPYKTDAELGGGGGDPTDTGWRNLTHADLTAGKVMVRRVGNVCWFVLIGATWGTKSGTFSVAGLVPAGFYPDQWLSCTTDHISAPARAFRFLGGGDVQFYSVASGDTLRATMTFPVSEPIPATLPGTAA